MSVAEAAAVNWTIADKLAARDTARKAWEADFNKNMAAVADKISESITADVLEALGSRLSDSYAQPIDSKSPLYRHYSLDLKRDSSKVKEWSKETAELQPFKEWFEVFEAEDQKRAVALEVAHKGKAYVRILEKDIEVSYFQDNMAQIGKRVETKVSETLRAFTAQPANSALRTKVEWYRSSESRGFSSIKSDARSEELRVSLWIDSNDAQGGCVLL